MNKIVVLDSNLLVSAALFENSVPRKAYNRARFQFKVVSSAACFSELSEVLYRSKFKKYIDIDEVNSFLEIFERETTFIPITHHAKDCRDPKDDKFLDVALAASAHYIISGDEDLLVLHPYRQIQILTPAQFLEV